MNLGCANANSSGRLGIVPGTGIMLFLLLAMALVLTACHRPTLTCRSEYLDPSYLASERVNTPDPCRRCFYGQQIIVSWNLPHGIQTPVELLLHVRYGTREVETLHHTITHSGGYWIYRLINQDYWCREGIIAYKAQLCQEGRELDEWTHHLWAELIPIPRN